MCFLLSVLFMLIWFEDLIKSIQKTDFSIENNRPLGRRYKGHQHVISTLSVCVLLFRPTVKGHSIKTIQNRAKITKRVYEYALYKWLRRGQFCTLKRIFDYWRLLSWESIYYTSRTISIYTFPKEWLESTKVSFRFLMSCRLRCGDIFEVDGKCH